jgi:Zn-dependent alcohol dehydrogenase
MTASVTRIVAFVPDLMDRSKVAAAAEGRVRFVTAPTDLVNAAVDADVVVVDLGRAGVAEVLEAVIATGSRVIAFGSHVERSTLAAARAAGCQEVLARSEFFSDVAGWLA